jgi:cell division septation protein DedD
MIAAAAVLVLVLAASAGAAVWFLGNPLELFRKEAPPAVKQTPSKELPVVASALPPPVDLPAPPVIPPPIPGSFAIVVGTYDNARKAEEMQTVLRAQKIEPYYIDLVMAPEDVQRRLLIGRFPTREEAEAARAKLGPLFVDTRIVRGSQERLPVLPP